MKGYYIYKRMKAQMVLFWKLFISYNPVAIDLLQAFDILSMFQLNSWWLLSSNNEVLLFRLFISQAISAGC